MAAARFVATSVLPVPPLPLAIAMIMGVLSLARHGRAALRALHLGTRHAAIVGNRGPALGADARATGAGCLGAAHASATTLAAACTPAPPSAHP